MRGPEGLMLEGSSALILNLGQGFPRLTSNTQWEVSGQVGMCLEAVSLLPYALSFSSPCCWMLLPLLRNCSGISIQQSKGVLHSHSNYIVVLKVKWSIGVGGGKNTKMKPDSGGCLVCQLLR